MPELPDVETYKRYVDATALNKRIAAVHVFDTRFVKDTSEEMLRERLVGRAFVATRRRGKHLLIAVDEDGWLETHYGMSGRVRYFRDADNGDSHDRVRVDFEDGGRLAFVSRRRLGHMRLIEDADRFIAGEDLGIDALDLATDRERFREMLAGKRGGLKSALMDQSFIAGLGNVYSDEILFQARLDPSAPVQDLGAGEVDRLHTAMREVLDTAIASEAGWENVPDRLPETYLLPHRKAGGRCPRCGGEIAKRKVSGRTAYLCPRCQR